MLQKLSPALKSASRPAQNRAPQTILFSTRAKKEIVQPHAAPIAMVQKATVASKTHYSALLAEQATEQYKEWQKKVDTYEAQVQQARQRYEERFAAMSGTMSKEQLAQEQQKYIVWEQGVRANEMLLQQQRASYMKRLQSFQTIIQSKSPVTTNAPKHKVAFVNVESSTHTMSEGQVDMQARLAAREAALLQREKRVAEEENHVHQEEKKLAAREQQDVKKEKTMSDREGNDLKREGSDLKREQADAIREQKDLQLENQEKYLQAQIQQSQQILWQEAAGLQAREMQAAQATQAARAAQAAAQQVEAQAEQVLAYTNPQRLLVQKARAKAETKADAETFRFQLGSSVRTVRKGQPLVVAQPAGAMPYAQPVQQPVAGPPPAPQVLAATPVQQIAAAPPAVPQARPVLSAKAQEQAAQLLPVANPAVINHGAPKQALLQMKQSKKVQHNAMQTPALPQLPTMEKAMKTMPLASDNADNDDDFPPPPAVDIPGVDQDHEDA